MHTRTFIAGFVSFAGIAIILLAGYGLLKFYHPVPRQPHGNIHLSAETIADMQALAVPVAGYNIHHEALDARAAIRAGDFARAEAIMGRVALTDQCSHTNPTSQFLGLMIQNHDAALRASLDKWVASSGSGLAYLARAWSNQKYAWEIRGNGYWNSVPKDDQRGFLDALTKSMADSLQVIHKRPDIPTAWLLLLENTSSMGDPTAQEVTFKQATAKFPDFYPLYSERLVQFSPRWGGDLPQMYAFVADTLKDKPPESRLRMLQIEFLQQFLLAAQEHCPIDMPRLQDCYQDVFASLGKSSMKGSIEDALKSYASTDRYTFNLDYDRLLSSMDIYSNYQGLVKEILDVSEPIIGPGNYALDHAKAYALGWTADKTQAANDQYAVAVHDLTQFQFPDAGSRARRSAEILAAFAWNVHGSNDDNKAMQIFDAASAADDTYSYGFTQRCTIEYGMNRFQQAVDDCTHAIELQDDNPYSEFYRAEAYQRLGQADKAVTDYIRLSDFRSADVHMRASAVTNVAIAYLDSDRNQEAVAFYQLHPEMFDTGIVGKTLAAESFDNICAGQVALKQFEDAKLSCDSAIALGYHADAEAKKAYIEKQLAAAPAK